MDTIYSISDIYTPLYNFIDDIPDGKSIVLRLWGCVVILYRFRLFFTKPAKNICCLIWQNVHGTICDIAQVYHPFDFAPVSYHVTAQRPERFLFIITGFYVPAESIKEQRNIFHPCTAGTVQGCFFLPGTENLQVFRENGAEKQASDTCAFDCCSDISQNFSWAKNISQYM